MPYNPQEHPNIEKLRQILTTLGPMMSKIAQQRQSQGGGSPVVSPAQVPQVNYDPSGASGKFPLPVARPASPGFTPSGTEGAMMSKLAPEGAATFSAIQGVSKLLQDFESRKDQREQSEAANIAQNLMSARERNDVATVYEIMNDKHSRKVLNKVYKGWLTKAKEAQKPGEPPDQIVASFEQGIQDYIKGKSQQQPQMPRTIGGYLLPQAGPAERLSAAQLSAEEQAAKQDPNRLLGSQLSSGEVRESELQKIGMTREAQLAALAKYQSAVDKAEADTKIASSNALRAQADLQRAQTEAGSAKEKGALGLEELKTKLLTEQAKLDAARARLQLIHSTAQGRLKEPPLSVKTRWDALTKAFEGLDSLEKSKKLYGFGGVGGPSQELKTLQGQLRMAGLSSLASTIPTSGFFTNTDTLLQQLRENMTQYRDSVEQGISENYPSWKIPGGRGSAADSDSGDDSEGDDSEDTPSTPKEGEPMEGDIVDGFRFKGGDPANQANWEPAPAKKEKP